MAIFAIGDVHGCNRTLRTLLNHLSPDPGDTIVFVGDYIDRGPDSKGVFDTIFMMKEAGLDIRCIRGNHEQMLLDAVRGSHRDRQFFGRNGGDETLNSFHVDQVDKIAPRYLEFIDQLPYFLEIDRYIFVHGGLDFSIPDPFDRPAEMIWARYWYDDIDYNWLGNRIILHGHTPTPFPAAQKQIQDIHKNKGSVINLDTGCVYKKRKPGLGVLTAVNLETLELTMVKNIDM